MAKKTYPVLRPILSDKRYEPGEEIILEDKDAQELAAIGAIGKAAEDAPEDKTPGKAPGGK